MYEAYICRAVYSCRDDNYVESKRKLIEFCSREIKL